MATQSLEPNFNEIPLGTAEEINLRQIWGTIPTVTETPTYTPNRFEEQFRISSTAFYSYDTSNNAWRTFTVLTTPITVANGGTGVVTLGDAGVLIGNGTGVVQVTSAGTTGQSLKSNGVGVDPTFQATITTGNGIANREFDAASGTQTIAHGLGATPKFVRLTAGFCGTAINENASSYGTYNGTSVASVSFQDIATKTTTSSTTNVLELIGATTTNFQTATIAIDATNITLTWTKGGIPASITMRIMWEAIA